MSDKKEISKVVTDLKAARETAGLSQTEVGILMGYVNARTAQAVVSGWESGARDPTALRLEAWAEALGVMLEIVPKK
jgi:transcriptional regulator with XRE-family HTH domain